jgi:hypothetical protein
MIDLQDIERVAHADIMDREDYFDICKSLTEQHVGSFALYRRGLFNYNAEWTDADFGFNYKRKFFTNRDGVNEYTEEQRAVPGVLECTYLSEDGALMTYLKEILGFRHLFATLNHQEPGHVVGVHSDHFRTLVRVKAEAGKVLTPGEIHRFVVMLDDQQIGHSFMVGLESLTWRAGDVIEFPWYALHATANAGLTTKRLISVAGVY